MDSLLLWKCRIMAACTGDTEMERVRSASSTSRLTRPRWCFQFNVLMACENPGRRRCSVAYVSNAATEEKQGRGNAVYRKQPPASGPLSLSLSVSLLLDRPSLNIYMPHLQCWRASLRFTLISLYNPVLLCTHTVIILLKQRKGRGRVHFTLSYTALSSWGGGGGGE